VSKTIILALLAASAFAAPVTRDAAEAAAASRLDRDGMEADFSIVGCSTVESSDGGALLAYAFDLAPTGYVIVSADDALPPVVAYSYTNGLNGPAGSFGMIDLVRLDLESCMSRIDMLPCETAAANRALWAAQGSSSGALPSALEQWPPAGSTPTGGWLEENWTQGSPYNAYCPMDLIAGSRSVAGCPAVAMGMILDNLETTHGTRFSDSDDYYHNYHEFYWIDNDYVAHDFPSWTELNSLLDVLDSHYSAGTPLTDSDKAALVFASGSACTQVYTASSSGTFGVDQAYDAYLRFGFPECQLLVESSESLFVLLPQNMMDARPAHLAIVDAGWQYGHNIVVDGYNTDDYYHFNFGWGGGYNGWYQFPLTGMPYSMNIIEGIIIDIGVDLTSIEDGTGPGSAPIALSPLSNPVSCNPGIGLTVGEPCHVDARVYSIDGRLMDVLVDGQLDAGSHQFCWGAEGMPSGVYLVRASCPSGSASLKITLAD
jgi:hypothetical protein